MTFLTTNTRVARLTNADDMDVNSAMQEQDNAEMHLFMDNVPADVPYEGLRVPNHNVAVRWFSQAELEQFQDDSEVALLRTLIGQRGSLEVY